MQFFVILSVTFSVHETNSRGVLIAPLWSGTEEGHPYCRTGGETNAVGFRRGEIEMDWGFSGIANRSALLCSGWKIDTSSPNGMACTPICEHIVFERLEEIRFSFVNTAAS